MEGNNSNVMSLISKMDEERKIKQKRSKGNEKRLTVVLSEYDYRRLKYIAKHFGELPSVLARNLLLESLKDAENFLELVETDDSRSYYDETIEEVVYEYTEYGKFVNGLVADPDDEEEDQQKVRKKRIVRNADKGEQKED